MTNRVVVYSLKKCSCCDRAKEWLKDHNIQYDEILLDDAVNRSLFIKKYPKLSSVPQIFLRFTNDNEVLIGGYNEMVESDAIKKLF